MKCPECGLLNPEGAMRCDCGFAFTRDAPPLRGIPKGVARSGGGRSLLRWLGTFNLVLAVLELVGGIGAAVLGAQALGYSALALILVGVGAAFGTATLGAVLIGLDDIERNTRSLVEYYRARQ